MAAGNSSVGGTAGAYGAGTPNTTPAVTAAAAAAAPSSAAAGTGSGSGAGGGAGGAAATTKASGGTKSGGGKKASSSSTPKLGKDGKPLKKKARKKKPSTSRPSAVNQQAIVNAANSAKAELAHLKAAEIARRSDPLWFEAKEVCFNAMAAAAALKRSSAEAMVSSSSSSTNHNNMVSMSASVLPNQVEIVEAALRNNNLTRVDVTPQAFTCLLEQTRRHALDLLADAQDYAHVANRHDVSTSDLFLAADLRADGGDFLTDVATQQPKLGVILHETNKKPLPTIPTNVYDGIALPPKHHQVTARTFDIVSGARTSKKMMAPPPSYNTTTKHVPTTTSTATTTTGSPEKKKMKRKSGSGSSTSVGYGARRGSQIPIQLKGAAAVTAAAAAAAAASAAPASTTIAPSGGPTPMAGVTPTPSTTKPMVPAALPGSTSSGGPAPTSSSPMKPQSTHPSAPPAP